jgi:DMSO/TMAO reductase YedYZ molybdopterin-dependent catalytic subunit
VVISTPNLRLSRRSLLKSLSVTGGCIWTGLDRLSVAAAACNQNSAAFPGGTFLDIVPFSKEGRVPLNAPLGEDLDGRLYTDLSELSAGETRMPLVPTDRFYIRTRASSLLKPNELSAINLFVSASAAPQILSVESLRKRATPIGTHLLECAGNTRDARFGLISVAEWSGVPLVEVLERLGPAGAAAPVSISGFDTYASPSQTSQPGASWIFSPQQIRLSGAFLATEMNARALSPDHGAPIRLVMPGWYGCTCIKWVNEIRVVNLKAEPTSQMQEFAMRTHQQGSPKFAADYAPATIDAAAMPVRVEKWSVSGEIKYRVIGIQWGGNQSVRRLEIRFNPEEHYVPVDSLSQNKNDPWTLWTHVWNPAASGSYLIRLRVAEPKLRTRRLDMGFYVREVEISEI